MVVKSCHGRGATRFMAVRFGNVLGSSGLLELELATRGKDAAAVVRRLSELVPTFRPAPAHTPVPRAAS